MAKKIKGDYLAKRSGTSTAVIKDMNRDNAIKVGLDILEYVVGSEDFVLSGKHKIKIKVTMSIDEG